LAGPDAVGKARTSCVRFSARCAGWTKRFGRVHAIATAAFRSRQPNGPDFIAKAERKLRCADRIRRDRASRDCRARLGFRHLPIPTALSHLGAGSPTDLTGPASTAPASAGTPLRGSPLQIRRIKKPSTRPSASCSTDLVGVSQLKAAAADLLTRSAASWRALSRSTSCKAANPLRVNVTLFAFSRPRDAPIVAQRSAPSTASTTCWPLRSRLPTRGGR